MSQIAIYQEKVNSLSQQLSTAEQALVSADNVFEVVKTMKTAKLAEAAARVLKYKDGAVRASLLQRKAERLLGQVIEPLKPHASKQEDFEDNNEDYGITRLALNEYRFIANNID